MGYRMVCLQHLVPGELFLSQLLLCGNDHAPQPMIYIPSGIINSVNLYTVLILINKYTYTGLIRVFWYCTKRNSTYGGQAFLRTRHFTSNGTTSPSPGNSSISHPLPINIWRARLKYKWVYNLNNRNLQAVVTVDDQELTLKSRVGNDQKDHFPIEAIMGYRFS